MSFLKLIMKPFVEFKDEPQPETAESNPPVQATTVRNDPPPVATAPVTGSTGASTNAPAATYQKHFEDLIEEANAKNPIFQGTDFKEFIDSKVDVESIADEAIRYQTAFNVLKRTGLTKEKLVNTGKEYINLIDQDIKGFEAAFATQFKADVAEKERLLAQKALELKSLNEKIAALNTEMASLSGEVTQNKDRLNANRTIFLQAGEQKRIELQGELEKINRYF